MVSALERVVALFFCLSLPVMDLTILDMFQFGL